MYRCYLHFYCQHPLTSRIKYSHDIFYILNFIIYDYMYTICIEYAVCKEHANAMTFCIRNLNISEYLFSGKFPKTMA